MHSKWQKKEKKHNKTGNGKRETKVKAMCM